MKFVTTTGGFQQITGLNTVKTLTVPSDARGAYFQAISQDVMFRCDGTAPDASTGIKIVAGAAPIRLEGSSIAEGQVMLGQLKFIEVTGSATLSVQYFH